MAERTSWTRRREIIVRLIRQALRGERIMTRPPHLDTSMPVWARRRDKSQQMQFGVTGCLVRCENMKRWRSPSRSGCRERTKSVGREARTVALLLNRDAASTRALPRRSFSPSMRRRDRRGVSGCKSRGETNTVRTGGALSHGEGGTDYVAEQDWMAIGGSEAQTPRSN